MTLSRSLATFASSLAAFSRLIRFDKRGTGLSDRVREVPTLETRMDDIRAVMDAAGSERACLWSGHEGTRSAILFAATYPERTAGLVLLEPSVRGTATPDYPWSPTEKEWRHRLSEVRASWGRRDFFEAPYPCSTLVEVKGLVFPELKVEIDGWARLDVDLSRCD